MLERFHVPPEIEVRVDPAVMRGTVEELFVALGMPRGHAEQSADVLLYADVRGIDSHGVSNMLRYYVDAIRDGGINLQPRWRITHDSPAACTIDSDGAHGGVIGPEAMRIAIERARQYGIGSVAVYNGGHYGAAAYTAAMALDEDMIGVSMTAGGVIDDAHLRCRAARRPQPARHRRAYARGAAVHLRRLDELDRRQQGAARAAPRPRHHAGLDCRRGRCADHGGASDPRAVPDAAPGRHA